MHIAIDARFYRSSTAGIGRYTRALIRELVKIDRENQYTIIITPEDEDEFDQQILNLKSKILNFTKLVVPIIHYTVAEQIKFLKILNNLKPDLVHFTNFNHPIWYRGKFVITVHDLTLMLYPSGRQKSALKQFAFKKVMKNAVEKSRQIIAISEATKKDLIKYLQADQDKITVIYEGIDPQYEKIVNRQSSIVNKYKITKPYILFVSQWRPHKGLPELIKAFEILKSKHNQDIQLVITGKPDSGFPELPLAIRDTRYAKDIILPGFVPEEDLPALFAGAEAFVFPSHYEGFGLPPLEAMASGVPVISSNASCMPEVLGEAAVYFDPTEPADIADKINTALINADLKKKMIEKGFEQVKKYSWSKMAKETLQIYEKVLE